MTTAAQISTFKAGMYLYIKLRKIEPKCEHVDFNSFLSENQRNHLPPSALVRGVGRGNCNIYGQIYFEKIKGKNYYTISELNNFIKQCETDPSLLEYMTRKVH